jgi:hypothetical protein
VVESRHKSIGNETSIYKITLSLSGRQKSNQKTGNSPYQRPKNFPRTPIQYNTMMAAATTNPPDSPVPLLEDYFKTRTPPHPKRSNFLPGGLMVFE